MVGDGEVKSCKEQRPTGLAGIEPFDRKPWTGFVTILQCNNVNNALTQIHFNGTNFFNARLTQRVFPV